MCVRTRTTKYIRSIFVYWWTYEAKWICNIDDGWNEWKRNIEKNSPATHKHTPAVAYNGMSVSRALIQTNKRTNTHTPRQPRGKKKEKERGRKKENGHRAYICTQAKELNCVIRAQLTSYSQQYFFSFLFDAVIVVTYAVSLFSVFHSLQYTLTHTHMSTELRRALNSLIHIPHCDITQAQIFDASYVVSLLLLLLFCLAVCVHCTAFNRWRV